MRVEKEVEEEVRSRPWRLDRIAYSIRIELTRARLLNLCACDGYAAIRTILLRET